MQPTDLQLAYMRDYLSEIGSRGGRSKSLAKLAALEVSRAKSIAARARYAAARRTNGGQTPDKQIIPSVESVESAEHQPSIAPEIVIY